MRHHRPATIAIAAVFLIVLPGIVSLAGGGATEGLSPGHTAPRFSARQISGEPVELGGLLLSSKAVLINFWGVRCGSCIEEFPHLNRMFEKYRGSGLAILGVNVDGIGSELLKNQMERLPAVPTYPVVTDEDFRVSDAYGLSAAPLTVLVDSQGNINYLHEGFSPGDEIDLEKRIEGLLR